MKGGFCIIYKSLLTLSVISSCALFLLVVSEALQGDANSVDLSGLHNVSQKSKVEDIPDPPSAESQTPSPKTEPDNIEMIFAETLSLNSVTTDGLPDTGQPPILISLAENEKLELKPPGEVLFGNESEHNDTHSFILVDGEPPPPPDPAAPADAVPEPHLVVRARPMHETKPEEPTTPPPEPEESQDEPEPETDKIPKPETPQEDIPSFSEWAQKQLAEAEKQDTVLNHSSQPSHSNTNFSSKNTKLRSKNYASLACGAKVVAVNPEAGSASSILSPNRDEYMLNTCNSRIWFVVELCEAVQAQKIEIANFELFSSTPKDILVYFSDRFPTREWTSVGQFTAKDMRDVQSFDLYPHLFGKFIKVEMLSHHGSEHYCPVSLFKVYGTSEFEVLEKESAQHAAADEDEDEDVPDAPAAQPAKNLFGSARDAVMSIMKKAAQALVKTEVPKNMSEQNDTSVDAMYKRCCSPSHIIVCDNCSETLYNEVYELISCSSDRLTSLVRQVFMRETLKCTGICAPFGLDFKSTKMIEFSGERVAYMNALFPTKYLAALCNIVAIKEKKVVLNTSFETEQNTTVNETVEESPQKLNGETTSDQEVKLVPDTGNSSDDKINDTELPESKPAPPEQTVITNVPVELPKEEKEKSEVTEEPPRIEEKPLEPQEELKPPEPEKAETKVEDVIKVDVKNGKEGEKMRETGSGAEEVDPMLMDSDSFMSELDQMAVDPTPAGAQAQTTNQQNPIQKESVFLRLSNRVKTLERNMSLSGQYLEELSRRYKKQVEEMQKTFEKTVQQMTEERRRSAEREQKYLEQMAGLQEKLSHTTASLTTLMDDRDSWFGNITFFKFIFYQSIIIAAAVYYVTKTRKPEKVLIPVPRRKKKQERVRRKSVEGVSGHETPSAKKRRPSEEALQITRHCIEVLDDDGEWQIARKNRRRKTSIVHRIEETKANWRPENIHTLQENPIPLDEEEFFAPVSEPAEFQEPKKEPPKVNGSFFNNLKTKTMKTRRLSSPAFLRTFSRQSSRSNPAPPQNGKASDSPTGSLWSASTDLSRNGHDSKRKKSLKNIFKKVF